MAKTKIIVVNGKELWKAPVPIPNDPDSKPKRCAIVDKCSGKLIGFFPININPLRLKL